MVSPDAPRRPRGHAPADRPPRTGRPAGRAAWGMALATACCAHAATPLMIWPVTATLEPGQRATALWLENRGAQPASMQVRIVRWQQLGGQESFAQQDAIVASPPISFIAPGARQLVRLVAAHAATDPAESAYRVIIDELPSAPAPDMPPEASSVRLQIRYSVPLFVHGSAAPADAAASASGVVPVPSVPQLAWSLEQVGDASYLSMDNSGPAHARITAVRWMADGQEPISVNAGLLGYVLPHARMRWALDRKPPPNALLAASINGRPALVVPRAAD